MLAEIVRSIPKIEQALPYFITFTIPILGITLQQAAKTRAKILANNLKSSELHELRIQVRDALNDEQRALEGMIELTSEIARKASLARIVRTKINSASQKRDESRPQKHKKRAYM
jgi:hypothetical protein